ncbi:MAG TPA: sulfatase [Myxococcota bacterium]|nr:sulfatase [Myxococcota bacterium]
MRRTGRRAFWGLAAAALAAAAPLACREPARARPPNLVLVSVDSLRADHLHAYGYPRETSPTFDRLAREGARFESAVSTTSWTLPAHAALFTGLYDSTHGLVDNGLRLAPELTTLAETLARAGYHTAGFYGGPYLHPTFGLSDGFEVWESCMTAVPGELSDAELRAESRAPRARSHGDVTGPRTLERVARWAERQPRERPFFLFVHLWDVHYDFIPPPPYDRLFDPDYRGTLTGVDFMGNLAVNRRMDRRDLEHLVALYDGEIRFTDDVLGRLLDDLRARGLLGDALVVVTADHGEEFFEHGRKGHQKTLFDEVVRVPLVLHWPGRLPAGRVVPDQVRLVDLAPTLLAAAGVPAPAGVDGRDVLPLARGEPLAPQDALLELYADGRDQRALRTRELKAYARRGRRGRPPAEVGYDLRVDPGERVPLRRRDDARVDAAFASLDRARAAALARRRELGGGARETAVDDETRRRLEQLGYLDGARDK